MNSLHCHLISIQSCYCSPHFTDSETDMGTLVNLAKIRGLVSGSTGIQTPGLKLSIPLSQIGMGSNPPGSTASTHLSFHIFKMGDYSTYSVLVDNIQQKSTIYLL